MNAVNDRGIGVAAAVALLLAVGCQTDSPSDSPDPGTDGGTYADAGADGTTSPGTEAASVEALLDPDKYVYSPGETVTGHAIVRDDSGAELSDASTNWSAGPEGKVEKTGSAEFEFKGEGTVTFEACAPLSNGGEVCGTKEIIVDAGPPTVQITSPKAGAFLGQSSDSDTIEVVGKVTDSHGTVRAVLNGEKVELGDDGTFQTEIPADFGVNNIRLTATDGINRTNPSAIRQVIWAPGYESIQGDGSELSIQTKNGVAFRIGQNFFDDAEPPEKRASESKIVARDLADILNLLITNIDFASQLPNPLIDNQSARLEINSVQFGDPVVVVDLTDDGLDAFVHIDQMVLQTSGSIDIEGKQFSLNGSIQGRISSFVDISIEQDSSSGEFSTTVDELELSIDEVSPNFADQKANALFELAESTIRTNFEDRLRNTLRSEVISVLPDLLDDQLNSLQDTLSEQSFEFGSDVTGTRQINFSGEVDQFELNYRKAMTGLLKTDVAVGGSDEKSKAPGTPLLAPNSTAVPWFEQSRLQIALRMRLLNGLLTAVWKTGFLDLDLQGVLPDQYSEIVEKAELTGKLPPVIRPAQEEEPHDLVMEVGQLELDTKAAESDDRYGLRLRAGINVALNDNELELTVPEDPNIEAWVIETGEDGPFLEPDALESLVLSEVWPSLKSSLQDGLAISLPAPSLSGLKNIAPTLTNMMLEYALPYPAMVRDGYLVLDSQFRGVLPIGSN